MCIAWTPSEPLVHPMQLQAHISARQIGISQLPRQPLLRLRLFKPKLTSIGTGMQAVIEQSQTSTGGPAFFWMPDDKPYGAFSHWYEAPMANQEGLNFPTVEHYMMYHKAKLFEDAPIAKEILACASPEDAKAAGRKVNGFDTEVWKAHRDQIVFEGNLLKFSQHAKLAALLLATGDRELVEASPEDNLWGIGFSAIEAADNRKDWGQNLCGLAIERVRTKLHNS